MKKTLSLFVALLLLLSSFAALAEGDTSKDTWLCDEKTTLTVLTYDAASNTMPAPSNDLPFWAWLEDYTNVHIEWEVIPQASYNEVLSARLSAGAGLVVAFTGEIIAMPGLPKVRAANNIDVTDDGVITGLF